MAERKKKEPTTNSQDTEYVTYAHMPLAKHRKSYSQADQQDREQAFCYCSRGHLKSQGKGKDEKVKEQLGRTIYSTTALYHDPLM